MFDPMPSDWRAVLAETLRDPRMAALEERVSIERKTQVVYPARQNVFAAFRLTPYASVRAVIIGQDPYPGEGQAEGLAFSVPPGVRIPASLRNILAELAADTGQAAPVTGSLVPWAQHGVLLLNTYLTVRAGEPASHRRYGWQLLDWGGDPSRECQAGTGGLPSLGCCRPGPRAVDRSGAPCRHEVGASVTTFGLPRVHR